MQMATMGAAICMDQRYGLQLGKSNLCSRHGNRVMQFSKNGGASRHVAYKHHDTYVWKVLILWSPDKTISTLGSNTIENPEFDILLRSFGQEIIYGIMFKSII